MSLTPEELLLLSAINVNPEPEELVRMDKLITQISDWDYLAKLTIENQAGPLLFKNLQLLSNNHLVPEIVKSRLKQSWLKTLSRSMVLIEHFQKVMAAFQAEDIKVICLKGIYLSEWLYKEIGLRQFSDIDLLVKERDGDKAVAILRTLGYHSSDFVMPESLKPFVETQHYPPMFLNGVSFEIHTKIQVKLQSYHVDLNELWENATPVTIHGIQTFSLSLNHLLLHLCLHLDKHVASGKIQFTCYYDIVNLLNQYAGKIDWNSFADSCKRFNATENTYKYLLLSNKYFNAKLPDYVIRNYGSFLKRFDEKIFVKFLVSGSIYINYSSSVVRSVGTVKGAVNKLTYVRRMLFPSKSFMIQRYKLKNELYLAVFYPYRFCVGILQAVLAFYNLLQRIIK